MNIYTCYQKGKEIQKNEEAASYFKKSADFGFPIAIIKYAQMLNYGIGVQIDKNESIKYEKALLSQFNKYILDKAEKMCSLKDLADSGNSEAMYEIGMLLYFDSFVNEENISESKKYLQRAAYLGDSNAWFILGSIKYRNEKNKEEGIKFITYAAEDGYLLAQIWLSINALFKNGFL